MQLRKLNSHINVISDVNMHLQQILLNTVTKFVLISHVRWLVFRLLWTLIITRRLWNWFWDYFDIYYNRWFISFLTRLLCYSYLGDSVEWGDLATGSNKRSTKRLKWKSGYGNQNSWAYQRTKDVRWYSPAVGETAGAATGLQTFSNWWYLKM